MSEKTANELFGHCTCPDDSGDCDWCQEYYWGKDGFGYKNQMEKRNEEDKGGKMKTERNPHGWSDIKTVNFKVEKFSLKPFMPVNNFIESNERTGLEKGRKNCHCCKTSWKELDGDIHLLFTDKGNKLVCDNCYFDMLERGVFDGLLTDGRPDTPTAKGGEDGRCI